jgi:hypothetical protein
MQNRIGLRAGAERGLRKALSGLAVKLRPGRVIAKAQRAIIAESPAQHPHSRIGHFRADAIAGYDGNFICVFHGSGLRCSVRHRLPWRCR